MEFVVNKITLGQMTLSIALRIFIATVFNIFIGICGEQNYIGTDLSLSISLRNIIALQGEERYRE